jgi:glycosyltransferase involved in cell wall biosynthesis
MKVLVAHNRYRSGQPSGENVVVDREISLLRQAGVEVVSLLPSSDGIAMMTPAQKLGVALGPVVNLSGVAHFRQVLDESRPDIVHLHNLSPLISPAVVPMARFRRAPVVATVHNFRRTCVSGSHRLHDRPCFACQETLLPVAAVRNACYRGSRVQSAAAALGQVVHHRTWRIVDMTIAPSRFVADRLQATAGGGHVRIRPHWCPDPGDQGAPGTEVLFVGRLAEDKGILSLLEAWQLCDLPGTRLRIVGDGPMRAEVDRRAGGDRSVTVTGELDRAGVAAAFLRAGVVVVPSRCEETFNLVAAEALSFGRPVVVTSLGALPELVDRTCGAIVEPQPAALAAGIAAVFADRHRMGADARRRYIHSYSPAIGLSSILGLYDEVLRADPARGRLSRSPRHQ